MDCEVVDSSDGSDYIFLRAFSPPLGALVVQLLLMADCAMSRGL
jgi:hypothetical protein